MKKNSIWLLRHGKTEGPAALNGSFDASVDDLTQQQINQWLVDIDLPYQQVISSPLSRCLDLARLLPVRGEVVIQPDFQEMNFGELDGIPFDQMPKHRWDVLEKFWQHPVQYPLPGGETLRAFHDRVCHAWSEMISTLSGDTLVVTHGGVIRMILAHVLEMDWQNPSLFTRLHIANQSLTHLEIITGEYACVTVKSIGLDISRLKCLSP